MAFTIEALVLVKKVHELAALTIGALVVAVSSLPTTPFVLPWLRASKLSWGSSTFESWALSMVRVGLCQLRTLLLVAASVVLGALANRGLPVAMPIGGSQSDVVILHNRSRLCGYLSGAGQHVQGRWYILKCNPAILAAHVVGIVIPGVVGSSSLFASCTNCKCFVAGAVGSRCRWLC
jgi:hypothetical protein